MDFFSQDVRREWEQKANWERQTILSAIGAHEKNKYVMVIMRDGDGTPITKHCVQCEYVKCTYHEHCFNRMHGPPHTVILPSSLMWSHCGVAYLTFKLYCCLLQMQLGMMSESKTILVLNTANLFLSAGWFLSFYCLWTCQGCIHLSPFNLPCDHFCPTAWQPQLPDKEDTVAIMVDMSERELKGSELKTFYFVCRHKKYGNGLHM
jgi:hypothetical protein